MASTYQIRLCRNCGLRYPKTEDHPFGDRCPVCQAETISILTRPLEREPAREAPAISRKAKLHVLLDNIRSAWNVGSILRSADGFGFKHAYLCGITPTPKNADVCKTALGAQDYVTWSAHKDAVKLIKGLQEEGRQVWALEQTKNSKPIQALTGYLHEASTVLAVGNEVTGVDPGILELADEVVHIPMHGQKRSFNVAVAFGVAAQIMQSDLVYFPFMDDELL